LLDDAMVKEVVLTDVDGSGMESFGKVKVGEKEIGGQVGWLICGGELIAISKVGWGIWLIWGSFVVVRN